MNREVIFLWDILLIFKVLAFHLVKLTIVNFSSLGKVVSLRSYVERVRLTSNNSMEGFVPLKLVHDFQVSPYVDIIVNEALSKIKLLHLEVVINGLEKRGNLSIDSHCKGNHIKGDRDSGEASQGVNGNFCSGDKELGKRKMNKCVQNLFLFFYQSSSWSRHQNA